LLSIGLKGIDLDLISDVDVDWSIIFWGEQSWTITFRPQKLLVYQTAKKATET